MLFNSYEFILAFLPVTLLLYYLLNGKRLAVAANSWLLFASLFFYGWWDIKYVPLILGSILFNYTIGSLLADGAGARRGVSRKAIFVFGIVANLLLLGFFKYVDFFITNVNWVLDAGLPLLRIVLPLGISFFTITQIAFLVDAYEGLVEERNLLNYALFVTFFPHLLAGPILHHSDMMPQFASARTKVLRYRNVYLGILLFSMGLFKKVVLADRFSEWATAGFDKAGTLSFVEAWLASLSYTFQLYFDFSGYSDMAIGIGLLFNIRLPVNFNSPYKARSIIDFWKRWHITLTDFITTYVYTPILRSSGSITFANSLVAIFVAMLISGFWHGAGWTFILWGSMHGAALVLNHYWKKRKWWMHPVLGWLLTFNFANFSFVFFRAKGWDDATKVLAGMFGVNGVMLNYSLAKIPLLAKLGDWGVQFGPWLQGINGKDETWISVALAFPVILLAKNSNEIADVLKPSWKSCTLAIATFAWALMSMSKVSEFLYFQF
ncbi:MBOAT family protein [Geobacter hydrogenophilus]|uniref:Peptidoglycan O-acetyltransferase n=1 Tax=Geobacter hydrogenophilus TaxID=40983 RepID=A0A9W6G3G4_9BACT|nr:MBOAT family protein [Geobacter hydrogenophilus]MBT0892291.1 MBOAT family protein [Geobacter hydrogenophilus]GLI39684.1 peptidoglycan O-acetyltransferase [Geobacter hydrogenophilus]